MNAFFVKGKGGKKRKKLRAKKRPASDIPLIHTHQTIDSSSSRDDDDENDSSDSEYEDSDIEADIFDLKEECDRQLRAEGLDVHLASSFGNNKKPSMVQTMLMRYVKLIIWLYSVMNIQSIIDVGLVISTLIVEKYKMLPVYYQHLKDKALLGASTIIDVNENVQVLVNWFCVYRTSSSYQTDSSLLYNINLVLKTMRKVTAVLLY